MAIEYKQHPHYVPIIKWQTWEQRALAHIPASVAKRTLPCIEVRLPAQHKVMLDTYAEVWKYPALIDYSDPEGTLTTSRIKELKEFLSAVKGSGLLASPVLNPATANVDYPAIAPLLGKRSVALRLRLADVEQSNKAIATVKAALAIPGLAATADRLIVDLGYTPVSTQASVASLSTSLATMKNLGFKHIHLASGSFPSSLMHINGAGHVTRKDWALWEVVSAQNPALFLGFSDYGPLNPNWSEETLTRRGGRVVIRYALDDKWRIIRGQNATTAESIAISQLLLALYAAEFQGATFSFGDKLIADRADPAVPEKDKKCGHYHITEFWTHHISYVVKKQY